MLHMTFLGQFFFQLASSFHYNNGSSAYDRCIARILLIVVCERVNSFHGPSETWHDVFAHKFGIPSNLKEKSVSPDFRLGNIHIPYMWFSSKILLRYISFACMVSFAQWHLIIN